MTDHDFDFELLFNAAPDIVLVADAETGILVECNRKAEEILGWPRGELIGMHQKDIHPPDTWREGFSDAFDHHLTRNADALLETRLLTRRGEFLDVSVRAALFRHKDRGLILGVFRDITRQKSMEALVADLARFPRENPSPVLRMGHGGQVRYANPAALAAFLGPEADGPLAPPDELVQATDKALAEGRIQVVELRVKEAFYQFQVSPAPDADYANIYGLDVTEARQTAEALRRSEERYRLALKAAAMGSWEWNIRTDDLYWSENIPAIFDPDGRCPGSSFQAYKDCVHPEDRELVLRAAHDILAGVRSTDLEHRIVWPNGLERWVRITGDAHYDEHGAPDRMIGVVQDVTERRAVREHLEFLALHDPLTGLHNRKSFMDHLRLAMRRSERTNLPLALLYLDLDRFKSVNDTLGHAAGDNVLREVARRMEESVRETDVAARLGGDEFALLIQDYPQRKEVDRVADRLVQALSAPYQLNGGPAVLGVSIGIALYPEHGLERDLLMHRADEAMFRVKNGGRNGFAYFSGQ